MFIKSLKIFTKEKMIRDISFHSGLNLIVDNTPQSSDRQTGNNVGKTTVIELVDFCFGAKPGILYKDKENPSVEYEFVKNFLQENDVHIKAEFTEDLILGDIISIERNFLQKEKAVRLIDDEQYQDKDFEKAVRKIFYPNLKASKPTLRQLVSHNIRYLDENIEKTVKTLSKFTTNEEYETLYLYLLGCSFDKGDQKLELTLKYDEEKRFLEKLTRNKPKAAIETALGLTKRNIEELETQKESLDVDENYKEKIQELDSIKYSINKTAAIQNRLKLRKQLIEQAVEDLENQTSRIDMQQLEYLYREASANVTGIQKTFEELVNYHNTMLKQKAFFISSDLKDIENQTYENERRLVDLLEKEERLSEQLKRQSVFESIESIIFKLNGEYKNLGEYEGLLSQIEASERKISELEAQLQDINSSLFKDDSFSKIKMQKDIFNTYFSSVSKALYDETYFLSVEKKEKKNRLYIDFNTFNSNMGSGKKQGEVLCFDLAYILFARENNIPHLEFLLNDKKELLHINQFKTVCDFVQKNNIQLILPILRDKVPHEFLTYETIVLELNQDSKLFKIEDLAAAF